MLERFGLYVRRSCIGIIAGALSCAASAQPANNACQSAITIPSAGGVFNGDLAGATRDAISTSCPTSQSGVDVYYSIIPAQSAIYTIETCGTSFDTVLGVHAAPCPVSIATELAGACNDDACGFQSRVRVPLQAGQNYLIRVATFNGATIGGPFVLTVSSVPLAANDECLPTNEALTLDVPISSSNAGATTSFVINPSSVCGSFTGSGGGNDLFYRFTPPTTGGYTFSTCSSSSSLDAVVSVHAACADAATSVIGCNDDAGTSACSSNQFASVLTVALSAGQTYAVRVAGYRGTTGAAVGPFTLLVTRSTTATGACCTSSGSCVVSLAGSCSDQYLGDGVACTPSACGGPPPGACCDLSGVCSISDSTACQGFFLGDWTTCTPSACPEPIGACCVGSTCSSTTQSQCQPIGLAGAVFNGPGTTCLTSTGTQVCCLADFNKVGDVTIQDIFDFLNEWFAGSPMTQVGGSGQGSPSIQDIFSFLNAWFAGGC